MQLKIQYPPPTVYRKLILNLTIWKTTFINLYVPYMLHLPQKIIQAPHRLWQPLFKSLELAEPLTILTNMSMSSGTFPQKLKESYKNNYIPKPIMPYGYTAFVQ